MLTFGLITAAATALAVLIPARQGRPDWIVV